MMMLRKFLLVAILISTSLGMAISQPRLPQREVVIGYYDAEPSCWQDSAGNPRGVFIDLFEEIAERKGWTARWEYREWDGLLNGLKSGEIEVVPAIVRTEAREKFAIFTKEKVMLDWGAVLVSRGSTISTVLDLDGRKVGNLLNDYWFTGDGALSDLARSFGVQPEYIPFESYGVLFEALGKGEIEAAVGSNTLALVNSSRYAIEATPIIYNPVELTFAVSRFIPMADFLVSELDAGIAEIKANDPGRLQAILSNHLVPIRSEIVLPQWAVITMGLTLLLLTLLLVVFVQQTWKFAKVNRSLQIAVNETRKALEGKEAYLHETHHRVRNNLQLVVSLLRLEADSVTDPAALAALQEAKGRVLAMANIEELVYDAGDLDAEAFRFFLAELVSSFADRFGWERFSAVHEVDLGRERLPVGAATPLALIMNELLQNACLYGRNAEGKVELSIRLELKSDGKKLLTVKDSGKGFSKDFTDRKSMGLGFSLIEALSRQINGRMETMNDGGAVVKVLF